MFALKGGREGKSCTLPSDSYYFLPTLVESLFLVYFLIVLLICFFCSFSSYHLTYQDEDNALFHRDVSSVSIPARRLVSCMLACLNEEELNKQVMKQIWISNKLLSEIRIANVGHQHFFIKMKNVNEADLRMFLCSQPKKICWAKKAVVKPFKN